MPTLNEQCDPRHPLRKLGERIPWSDFEEAFGEYYSEDGRPAKPVRLMVGLLLLKQMYDQSDEDVVERWVENPYWQQFGGMSDFQWELPCDPSDLVYFRQRIGEQGVALILAVSAPDAWRASQRERSGRRQHRAGEEGDHFRWTPSSIERSSCGVKSLPIKAECV